MIKKRITLISLWLVIGCFAGGAIWLANTLSNSKIVVAPPVQLPPATQKPSTVNSTTDKVIETVFVLDTTGSMGGMIQAAKDKIWSIARSISQAKQAPIIKMGLVAYRDKQDDYITQIFDLTDDLDALYEKLMTYSANGGGDGPESVNQALYESIAKISWSKDSFKNIYLVGDAPPHMDYQDDIKYPISLKMAKDKNIFISAIQCGSDPITAKIWKEIANSSQGVYASLAQDGNAIVAETPFDKDMANLTEEYEKTKLAYGSKYEQHAFMKKKCCEMKHPDHSSELKRLNRLAGQVEGIKKMIESNRYCVDIITQLRAIQSASKAIETNILERHFEACVSDAVIQKNKALRDEKIEELMRLFRKS